ncbi:hypothetical protein P8452_37409 [Trifolium repens]|nr:hypothetical protein P8452_37409 [Trifolium repens]
MSTAQNQSRPEPITVTHVENVYWTWITDFTAAHFVVNAGLWQLAKNPSPVIRHMRTALLPIIGLAFSILSTTIFTKVPCYSEEETHKGKHT